jgi:hypothetical protein
MTAPAMAWAMVLLSDAVLGRSLWLWIVAVFSVVYVALFVAPQSKGYARMLGLAK